MYVNVYLNNGNYKKITNYIKDDFLVSPMFGTIVSAFISLSSQEQLNNANKFLNDKQTDIETFKIKLHNH